jgi:hypothetical protein
VRAPAWRVPHPLIGDHEAAPSRLHLRTSPALGRATAPHHHKRVLVGWSWRTANWPFRFTTTRLGSAVSPSASDVSKALFLGVFGITHRYDSGECQIIIAGGRP